MERSSKLRVLMNLSLMAAVILLLAKVTAAAMIGSSAIYSDAAESIVHLIVVCFGSYAIQVAQKPADESHHCGRAAGSGSLQNKRMGLVGPHRRNAGRVQYPANRLSSVS